jgi:hypothetical protein
MSSRTARSSRKKLKRGKAEEELSATTNPAGLPSLPTELLLEIAKYIPGVDVPTDHVGPLPKNYLNRSATLLALSQTCKWLRHALSAIVWHRFEVCASALLDQNTDLDRKPSWNKELTTELVRQIEIVTIRDPARAEQVQ